MAHDDAGLAFGRRPTGAPTSFLCQRCGLLLDDGVDYLWCPKCSGQVRWLNLRTSLWRCERCNEVRSVEPSVWPMCSECVYLMSQVPVVEPPAAVDPPALVERPVGGRAILAIAPAVLLAMYLAQLIVLALDPLGFVIVAPLALLAFVGAVSLLISLYQGRHELIALVRDRRTRVLHGLEHGCIELLDRRGAEVVDGQTYDGFFVCRIRGKSQFSDEVVYQAASEAARRIAEGEASLAYHPSCGTSLLVATTLVSVLIVAAPIAGIVTGIRPGAVMASVVVAATLLWFGSRPLGLLAQRALTVSTQFAAAWVQRVTHTVDASGDATFVVRMSIRLAADSPPAAGG